jgi:hypothetical protein
MTIARLKRAAILVGLLAGVAATPIRAGDWIADASAGCQVWNPHPQPNETIRWSGACPNGFAHGRDLRLGDRGTSVQAERRHCYRRWIPAWGLFTPHAAPVPLAMPFYRRPGFQRSEFQVSFKNRGVGSLEGDSRVQTLQRHARQEAAGTITQSPEGPVASGATIRHQAA